MTTKAEVRITAKDLTPAAFRSFERNARSAVSAATKWGSVMAGVAAAGAAVMVKRTLDNVDALAKQADVYGLSTQALAAYAHQAELAGTSQDAVTKSLKKMQENLVDASRGTGDAKEAFKALGLNLREVMALSPEQQFEKIGAAIASIEDPTLRVSAAVDVFGGRTGPAMLQFFGEGGKAIAAARAETEAFGLAITRLDASKVEAANDAMTRAQAATAGVATQFTVKIAPSIEKIANAFTDMLANSEAFKRLADDLATGFKVAADAAVQFMHAWELKDIHDRLDEIQSAMLPAAKVAEINRQLDEEKQKLAEMNEFLSFPAIAMERQKNLVNSIGTELAQQNALHREQADLLAKEAEIYNRQVVAVATKTRIETAHSDAAGAAGGAGAVVDAALARRFEALQNSLMNETELENQTYALRQETLAAALDAGLVQRLEYNELYQEVENEHQRKLDDIVIKSTQQRVSLKNQIERAGAIAGGQMAELGAAMMSSGNKKAFEIGKALAISSTIVSTYASAQQAYAGMVATIPGPVGIALGVAMAGMSIATGAFRVAQIRSQQFGGAGSLAAGAAISVPSVGAATSTPAVAAGGPLNELKLNLSLSGSRFSADDVAQLVAQIEDQSLDGRTRIMVEKN